MTTRSTQSRSVALAVLLGIGAGIIWGCIAGFIMTITFDGATSGWVHEQLLFLRDGTPIIQSYVGSNYQERTYRTLDGKRLNRDCNMDYNMFVSADDLCGPKSLSEPFHGLLWRQRVQMIRDNWYQPEVWYFVHDGRRDGHGYFVSYDRKSKSCVGYLGTKGVLPNQPPTDQQFPVDGCRMDWNFHYGSSFLPDSRGNRMAGGGERDVVHLLCDDGLRGIDLANRSVVMLRKGSDLISGAITSQPRPPAASADFHPAMNILLRTKDRVIVLAADGKEVKDYPLPAELQDVSLRWLLLPDGNAAALDARSDELFWLAPGGKIVRSEKLNIRNDHETTLMANAGVTVIVPSPGTVAGFIFCYPWLGDSPPQYSAALAEALSKMWPTLLITAIISAVLAVVCYRRQRAYGLPWTGVWTVFVLLFGVPAFLGYLAHRAWPARLACPRCRQPVPRDRPACLACGQAFPAPAPKGIEVFA
jgi:hypothetical protein